MKDIQSAIQEGFRLLKTAKVGHFITMGEDGIQVRPMGAIFPGKADDEVVLITYRVADLLKVIEAHRSGATLPAPRPAPLR